MSSRAGAGDPFDLLGEVEQLRERVRERNRPLWLWAALVAMVAVVGGVSFLLHDQLVSTSCGEQNGVMFCSEGARGFNGAAWVVAGGLALAVPFVARYRRGTWRPPRWLLVAALLPFVLLGPLLLAFIGGGIGVPIVYPTVTALALAVVAGRQGRWFATAISVLLAAAILLPSWLVDSGWYHDGNLGLAVSSFAVAGMAFVVAALWRTESRS